MRRRALIVFVVMSGVLGVAAHAGAQAHPTSCPEFTDQSAAQTYFDSQGADYQNLDTDGNGIACDESCAAESGTSTATVPAVEALPSTGSGESDGSNLTVPLIASVSMLLLVGAGIVFRRTGAESA